MLAPWAATMPVCSEEAADFAFWQRSWTLDRETAESIARRQGARAYTDTAAMLAAEQPQAVVVATPPTLHLGQPCWHCKQVPMCW